tara:strand:+ start:1873 stop:2310 length:438 start_codon:yes stop_codon:yes gene_type:complete
MINKRPTAQFPKAKSVGAREWGEEILLVLAEGKFTMKKLKIKKGFSGGLQYHRKKDEAAYILCGTLVVTYANDKGSLVKKKLKEGSWLHFPNGSIHQETALTDVEIIEVSTPHFNDRVRVEEKFGLDPKLFHGLPTTEENEIIAK